MIDATLAAELIAALQDLEQAAHLHRLDDTDITWNREQDTGDRYQQLLRTRNVCVFFAHGCRNHGYPYCPEHDPENL